MFTVGDSVDYEVYPEFQRQGITTEALKDITSRMDNPVLEITSNNFASKKTALKAGYKLVEMEEQFEIYKYAGKQGRTR